MSTSQRRNITIFGLFAVLAAAFALVLATPRAHALPCSDPTSCAGLITNPPCDPSTTCQQYMQEQILATIASGWPSGAPCNPADAPDFQTWGQCFQDQGGGGGGPSGPPCTDQATCWAAFQSGAGAQWGDHPCNPADSADFPTWVACFPAQASGGGSKPSGNGGGSNQQQQQSQQPKKSSSSPTTTSSSSTSKPPAKKTAKPKKKSASKSKGKKTRRCSTKKHGKHRKRPTCSPKHHGKAKGHAKGKGKSHHSSR